MTIEEKVRLARNAFENREIPDKDLIALYSTYNPIKDLDSFVRRAKELFPKANCGLASVYLKNLLGEGEIVQGRYASDPHTFLMLGGNVIDITADQYGGPAVYYGPLLSPWAT